MSTIREQIIEAVLTVLNTSTPPGVPACTRLKMEPMSASDLPAMTIFPMREEVQPAKGGRFAPFVERILTVKIVMEAAGSDTTTADQAVDPMAAWISQLGGSTLGGVALDTEEGQSEWLYQEGDFPYAALATELMIHYRTAKANASSVN